jgi:hypothetical protein
MVDITQTLPPGTCLRLETQGGALTVMADHAGWVRVMFSPVAGYWCSMADALAPADGVAFEVAMSAAAKQAKIDAKPATAKAKIAALNEGPAAAGAAVRVGRGAHTLDKSAWWQALDALLVADRQPVAVMGEVNDLFGRRPALTPAQARLKLAELRDEPF